MKRNFSRFYTSIIVLMIPILLTCQDVGISGLNGDSPDGFALVALVDIPSSQKIFFTDMEWDAASNSFVDAGSSVNEGTIQITWVGTWVKGSIIRVIEDASPFTVSVSTNGPSGAAATIVTPGDGFSLSPGESFNVYTASSATTPESTVTEVYSHVNLSTNPSINPDSDIDCPCSTDFIYLNFNDNNVDNFDYTTADRAGVTLSEFTSPGNYVTSPNPGLILNLVPEYTALAFGGSGIVVPVELVDFTASLNEAKVDLKWSTASEENNDFFEIQRRSSNGDFITIGHDDGYGNSSEMKKYFFQDQSPEMGVNQYRLKQVDYNGSFSYSKVISIQIKGIRAFDVFPNPFTDEINIIMNNNVLTYDIEVLDINGVLVKEIKATKDTPTINLSELKSGIYYIRQKVESNGKIKRIVKM